MAEPMYRQIAQDLQRRIESGELAPGDKLPSEVKFREMYNNASRNTIRDAVKWLIMRGLVETRPGQGTFVTLTIDPFVTILSSDPDPDIAAEGSVDPESALYLSAVDMEHRVARVSKPKVEIQTPAPEVAARLRVAPLRRSTRCNRFRDLPQRL
jgi:GntR family transcriptional regulator